MINKSIKYIGVILLAYTLNACNEQRMNSSSETTTPVWLAEVGKRDVRELTTTTGTAKAAKTVEVKSETNGKYELMICMPVLQGFILSVNSASKKAWSVSASKCKSQLLDSAHILR